MDQHEQLRTQVMGFQQVAELGARGLVPHRLAAQVDTQEAADGARVIEIFLGHRVGQVEPVLRKVRAEHALDIDWRAARTLRLGIARLDDSASRQRMIWSISSRNCS